MDIYSQTMPQAVIEYKAFNKICLNKKSCGSVYIVARFKILAVVAS